MCSHIPTISPYMFRHSSPIFTHAFWLFGMIRRLIGPPRGVWGSNFELTHVCMQMASKASQFFTIVINIWSIHIWMFENHNNICYWPHACMIFSFFQLFCAYFVNNIELWEYPWLLDPAVNKFSQRERKNLKWTISIWINTRYYSFLALGKDI